MKRIYYTYNGREADGGYIDFDISATIADIINIIGINAIIYHVEKIQETEGSK